MGSDGPEDSGRVPQTYTSHYFSARAASPAAPFGPKTYTFRTGLTRSTRKRVCVPLAEAKTTGDSPARSADGSGNTGHRAKEYS